ncbi:enoyl-CoA hydratase/isomerase family protein [Chloroflexota bacterium]
MDNLETVIYEKEGEIAWIKFNRPQVLNAENYQLAEDFLAALQQARRDSDVKVVILKGEGRAFCAGADIKERGVQRSRQERARHFRDNHDIVYAIRDLWKPIIAAVHGYALGAGLEYALACDLRITAEDTQFGLPEASVGASVGIACLKLLPQLVGLGKAKELIFTSKRIGAKEAERIGLVNIVVPSGELDKAALELAKTICGNSTEAIRLMRAAINNSAESSTDAVVLLETMIAEGTYSSEEAVKGFAAKREEVAKGK